MRAVDETKWREGDLPATFPYNRNKWTSPTTKVLTKSNPIVKRGDKSVRRNSVSRELESLNKDGVDSMSSDDSEKVNWK